jgi:hypothetical protein
VGQVVGAALDLGSKDSTLRSKALHTASRDSILRSKEARTSSLQVTIRKATSSLRSLSSLLRQVSLDRVSRPSGPANRMATSPARREAATSKMAE